MFDLDAYTTRAALAGPADFIRILVDGLNAYTAELADIASRAPDQDLPLVVAAMHICADSLSSQVTPPGFSAIIQDMLKRHISTTVATARVPKEKEDKHEAV